MGAGVNVLNASNCGISRKSMVDNDVGDQRKSIGSDCETLSTTSPSCSIKYHVSFDEVQIHEFAQWLGDNPACQGPPIALSWDCVNSKVVKIDDYESTRGRRKSNVELISCVHQRTNVIKWCCGYTDKEIERQEAILDKFRKSRESCAKRYRRQKRVTNAVKRTKAMTLKLLRI